MRLMLGMVVILIIVMIVNLLGKAEKAVTDAYKQFPVFEYIADFLKRDLVFEVPENTPEYQATQLAISLAGKVLYSWGEKEVDGYPVTHGGIFHLDVQRTKRGNVSTRVNLLQQVREKEIPIMAVKLGYVRPHKVHKDVMLIDLAVYTVSDREEVYTDLQALDLFEQQYAFRVRDSNPWELIKITSITLGHTYTNLAWIYGLKKAEKEENVKNIYMSKDMLKRRVSDTLFKYDTPSAFLDYVNFNAREF
jgi:hypothetical protein